jgi:hypothetical protein
MAAAGMLLSGTLAIGVWAVQGPTAARLSMAFGKADKALSVVEKGTALAINSLDRAAVRLKEIQAEQRKIATTAQPDLARRLLSQAAQHKLGPDLYQARAAARGAADAATLLGTLLEDFGALIDASVPGIGSDDLARANARLEDVSSAAWDLGRLLGDQSLATEAAARVSRIGQAVDDMREVIARHEPLLAEARTRLDRARDRTIWWLAAGPPLVTALGVWLALVHLGLLVHARGWWRRAGDVPTAST